MKAALLIAIALTAGNSLKQAASHKSKPAPALYVSQKFGLVMKVPSGLSYCPLPRGWSGDEEGTVLFLKPPSACLPPRASSITRPTEGFVPSITLRYHANQSRNDAYDGAIPSARTSEEFARQSCPGAAASPDLKLFDQPAMMCRAELSDDKVRILLMAVYDSARSKLVLTLMTTHDRLADDTRTLSALASSITACQPSSGKQKGEAACPKGNWW